MMQQLDSVTSQLQEAVVQTVHATRRQSVGQFPRMVRDLARQLGKEIELDVQGVEVELDKTILEALSDPLTHLIRNSCDHGIERRRRRTGRQDVRMPPAPITKADRSASKSTTMVRASIRALQTQGVGRRTEDGGRIGPPE